MGRRTCAISRLEFLLSRALSTEHWFCARLCSGRWSDSVHKILPGFLKKKNNQNLLLLFIYWLHWGYPGGTMAKNLRADAGDTGWIPGSGTSPGEGSGNNPLQYSCLENSMARRAWWTTVRGVAKSQTRLTK